jgi:hypothetical protein
MRLVSGSDDRRRDVTNNRIPEVLAAAERAQRDAELAMRKLDQQLLAAKWQWRLQQAEIPAHRGDGVLHESTRNYTTKASMGMDGLFCRLTHVTRHGQVLLIEATGPVGETSRVRGALHAVLRKSAAAPSLGQMHNPGLGPAGSVTEATVTPGGKKLISSSSSPAKRSDRPG